MKSIVTVSNKYLDKIEYILIEISEEENVQIIPGSDPFI